MSLTSQFPDSFPSLRLDFANSKRLDPRVTFTRASAARYYDGQTVAKAEENLLIRSQEFDNAAWTNVSITVATDATTAPDGTATADKATRVTTGELSQSPAVISAQIYTVSIFAKQDTSDFLQIALGIGGFTANDWANFNLSSGTVGNKGSSATASIQSFGAGWYRCVLTCTAVATQTASFAFCPLDADTNSRKPTNAASSANFLWGAQLEQRSSVTAYTPTTAQPITNYIPVLMTAQAGVPRFDHNPTTAESLGLLIEEQRANEFVRSENFNTTWVKANVTVTSNTVIAPNGTLTASTLTSTSTGQCRVEQSFPAVLAVTPYTMTVYAKQASSPFIGMSRFSGGRFAIFNLSTGALISNSGGTTASIQSVGNGWYRIRFTDSVNPADAFRIWKIHPCTSSSIDASEIGNSVYIWGAQLEAGAFPTSYIPTVASQVTRSADAATMTGTNFSSWYNAAEGTLYADFKFNGLILFPDVFSIGSSSTNFISISKNSSNNLRGEVVTNGSTTVNAVSGAPVSPNNDFKLSMAFATNNTAVTKDGAAPTLDTDCTIPVATSATIGNRTGSTTSPLNGTIRKIAYYPERLTNAQLQALTS
jgi:hypothetical protein